MRILLLQAPFHYPHPHPMRTELLGLTYLAAAARRAGHVVRIFDPTAGAPLRRVDGTWYFGVPDAELRAVVREFGPDVAGVSCHYAFASAEAGRVARLVKEERPGAITVLGGVYASVYQERALQAAEAFDFAVVGEAEETFPRLLATLSARRTLPGDSDGLVWREGGAVRSCAKSTFIEALDDLPFPARDLVDIRRYMTFGQVLYGLGHRPVLSLLTSRSCPHRCSFCNMWKIHGPRWRPRSPGNVLAEIDEIVGKHRAEHVFVMDDNFTFDAGRVKEICAGIIRGGYRFRWNTPNGISVKHVDAEMAQLMRRAGCANVCVGIETGSERLRNQVMHKAVSNAEIERAVGHFNAAGIPVGGFIVIGMPGEDAVAWRETVAFTRRLGLSFVAPTFAIPMPGTALFDALVGEGVIGPDFSPSCDNFNHPQYATRDFSTDELLRRRRELFLKFHASHLPRTVRELMTGRLTWVAPNMLRRFVAEKVLGV